jgi:hypothetical protein
MSWLPIYLDAVNAARNGEAAREAERRAMYARPDAPPLPDDVPQARASGRVWALRRSVSKVVRPALGWLRRPGQETADGA